MCVVCCIKLSLSAVSVCVVSLFFTFLYKLLYRILTVYYFSNNVRCTYTGIPYYNTVYKIYTGYTVGIPRIGIYSIIQ
jgi:hypothetical protein